MDKDEEFKKLRQIRWRTNLSRQIAKFSQVIHDDKVFDMYFGEKYVEKLASKSRELSRVNIKLAVVYALLMLALFASQNTTEAEFQVFGYGFKNLGHYKEFLLLLASAIPPVSAILSAYVSYIKALTEECLKKLAPDPAVRQFYSYTFVDEHFDGMLSKSAGPSSIWHGFAVFIMTAFVLTFVFLFLTLVAGSFLIQINVIYNVVTKPVLPLYVNLFIVTFSAASILFSWLVSLMQLPMPEVDLTNVMKLSKLKEENPKRYEEIMRSEAKEGTKKNNRSTIIWAISTYIAVFTVIAIHWFPASLGNLSYFLEKAVPGAFVAMILSYQAAKYIGRSTWAWFFRKYADHPNQMRVFVVIRRSLYTTKISIPLAISIAYALYALRAT